MRNRSNKYYYAFLHTLCASKWRRPHLPSSIRFSLYFLVGGHFSCQRKKKFSLTFSLQVTDINFLPRIWVHFRLYVTGIIIFLWFFSVHALYQWEKLRKILLIIKEVKATQDDVVIFRYACLETPLINSQVFATSEHSAHNLQHRGGQSSTWIFCINCLGTNGVWSPSRSAHHLIFEG